MAVAQPPFLFLGANSLPHFLGGEGEVEPPLAAAAAVVGGAGGAAWRPTRQTVGGLWTEMQMSREKRMFKNIFKSLFV